MRNLFIAAAALTTAFTTTALAADLTVGVSWSNFQEERWKTDEAAMVAALDAAGAKYVSADAQSSSSKQLSDVEALMAQGVDALIVLAQDTEAVIPAVQMAADEGIPVVAYDRLIEDPRAFYLTFDNVEVGRMQARAVFAAQPTGNYVMIKGSPTDPNADFLRGGQQEIIQAAVDSGDITIVGEAYTDGWLPANAQRNMEQILTAERQQGRCRCRLQRRHRRWRCRGADRAGHGRDPGFRPGRRPRRSEPRCQGHPDGFGLERRT